MIDKSNSGPASPPRVKDECVPTDLTPKLTPSSEGSSSNSSSGQQGHFGITISGHEDDIRTTNLKSPRTFSRSNGLRRQNDVSIFRGAALVRENLLSKLRKTDCSSGMLQRKSFDSEEWSDPWDEKRQEAFNTDVDREKSAAQIESAGSSLVDGSLSSPSLNNEQLHWAEMASMPIDEESFYKDQALPIGQCLDFSCRDSLKNIPALFDLRNSIEQQPSRSVHPEPSYNKSLFDESSFSQSSRRGSLITSDDGTHVTTMGRGRNLRVKIVTYNVQRLYESGDDGTYDESFESLFEDLPVEPETKAHRPPQDFVVEDLPIASECNDSAPTPASMPQDSSTTPEASLTNIRTSTSCSTRDSIHKSEPKSMKYPGVPCLSSPLSKEYEMLKHDDGFRHAQQAGYLWQSLLAHHVRFPKHWFDGLRAPPMGSDSPWRYVARLAVHNNRLLNSLVKTRTAPGRLLLHFLVRDLMTGMAVFDLAIGCFHPNAKGIRTTKRPDQKDDKCRHVWMAIRKVTGAVSILDHILCGGRSIDNVARGSPLGNNRRDVNNMNMRSVFGDLPPFQTICIQESELYQVLAMATDEDPRLAKAPALLLLKEFLVVAV